MFSPRSADTYTKEWPSGGDQGPVLGLGPFGSVPLQRSVKVDYLLVNALVNASFHTRREPRCIRRDRLILTPKSGLVVGIRDLCSVWAHSAAFRFSDQSKNRSLRHI